MRILSRVFAKPVARTESGTMVNVYALQASLILLEFAARAILELDTTEPTAYVSLVSSEIETYVLHATRVAVSVPDLLLINAKLALMLHLSCRMGSVLRTLLAIMASLKIMGNARNV